MNEPNPKPTLCSRNHRGTQRATVWLTPQALRQLEWMLEFYFRVLGDQPVSTSLVIRRSLEIAQDHIRQLLSRNNRDAILAERTRLKGTR